VTTAAANDPELVMEAKLALARCAQLADRGNDAQTKYREIVAADAPNDVLAGAWNGLGDLALKDGIAKKDADGLKYALFAYLRGVVLYVPERGGTTDEYERALAGAYRAFRACGELESDAAKKKLFLNRAQLRLEQLKADYPRSRYIPK